MSLIPFTFPLLKLPLLATQHIADFWDPFEIYNISMTSKKANSVAKLVSQKAISIFLNDIFGINVTVHFPNSDLVYQFCPCRVQPENEENYGYEPGTIVTHSHQQLYLFSKNPARDVLSITEHLVELFKCRTFELSIMHFELPFAYVKTWLRLFTPFRVKKVCYHFGDDEKTRVFFENFRSTCDELHICFHKVKQLNVPEIIEFEWPPYVKISSINHLNVSFLTRIDAPNLNVNCYGTVIQSLRAFLKSWQTGMTNSNLQTAVFWTEHDVILEEVLDGINTEIRTLKRFIRNNNEAHWVYKGADIQGPNGKIATVQSRSYTIPLEVLISDESENPEPFDGDLPHRQCYFFVL